MEISILYLGTVFAELDKSTGDVLDECRLYYSYLGLCHFSVSLLVCLPKVLSDQVISSNLEIIQSD